MVCNVSRRDKTLYLIQLQSHYSPAQALTDNSARISENVNTSKTGCSRKAIPFGRIKHYRTLKKGGGGLRNWVQDERADCDK